MRQSKFTDAQCVSILKEADADSILESAARFHAGILVMGAHGRTGWIDCGSAARPKRSCGKPHILC